MKGGKLLVHQLPEARAVVLDQIGAAVGKNVIVWNLPDAKQLLTLPHPAEVLSLSFSADKGKIR